MRNLTLLSIATLAAFSSAQQIVVPALQTLTSTGTTTTAFRTLPGRMQAAYDSSLFTAAGVTGPITITGLHFRLLNGRRNPGGQFYSNVSVEVGNCAVDHAVIVSTYATNRGTMGPAGIIPTLTLGAAAGTHPNDYVMNIDLSAVGATFAYDPTSGTDLLIDMTMPTDPMPAVPGGSGGGTTSAVSTTTVTQAAGHTFTIATGSRIRMTSGVNNGLIRTCSAASAGVSITHAAFPVANGVGSTFVVERLDMEGFAASSVLATHMGRMNSGTWTLPAVPGATGSLSAVCPVVMIDFIGPGGFSSVVPARTESYGAGCSPGAASFYQLFPVTESFDLRGPGSSLELTPDNPTAPNFYTVASGTTPVDLSPAAISGLVNVSDDTVTTHIPGFTFNFPGGSTTQFGGCPNGYVWLSTNTTGDFSPTLAEFLGGAANTARMAVAWNDMHAGRNLGSHPGSGMYVATDLSGGPGNGVTYVTWKEIGEFNSIGVTSGVLPPQGISANTFQIALFENGNVSMRYGAMSGLRGGHPSGQVGGFTGFSRGQVATVNAIDPGSRDLSIETPFTTGAEGSQAYLGHGVSARAVLGTSITFTGFNHPAGTLFGAMLIGFDALRPGINFFPVNAGCIVSLDPATAYLNELFFSPAGTVTSVPFAVPAAVPPAWMGAVLNTQYVVLLPDGSVSTSNALKHTLGLQ